MAHVGPQRHRKQTKQTYVSVMYELKKKIGKLLTSKSVGTGPSSYEKRIFRAAVSQRLRNNGLNNTSNFRLCLSRNALLHHEDQSVNAVQVI